MTFNNNLRIEINAWQIINKVFVFQRLESR